MISSNANVSFEILDMNQLRSVTLEDEELMKEIVAALVEDASSQIAKIGQAIERDDIRECGRIAHSARGACGNVGAASLAALFSELEEQSRLGKSEDCKRSINKLNAELEKLRSHITRVM